MSTISMEVSLKISKVPVHWFLYLVQDPSIEESAISQEWCGVLYHCEWINIG